jgi:iron complex transport system ATP-binding protein
LALQLADILWLMTSPSFMADTTEYLIESDSLDQLFESDLISFNKTLKQFTISDSR